MKNTLKIETIPIGELNPYENNAKLHPQEQIDQIVRSMQEFGNNDPIAIDENNRIIEGHGRLLALRQMGETEVPVIRLKHLTDEQKRAYILIHNQLTLNTGFDEELLRIELENIVDIDMTEYGFDLDIVDLHEEPPLVEEDSDFDVTPPEEPTAKPGDLYQLGCHRLLCGDSTSMDDVARLMGGEKAGLLLTDPPYNVAYEGGTEDKLTIQNDNMADEDFRQFLRDVYSAANSVMKPGASFYIWHADTEGYNFRGAARDIGWQIRECLIWNKNSLVLGRCDYHYKHEPCLYGWAPGAAHNWYGDRKQTTVLDFDKPARNGEHPTMKPVELFAYQMENSSKKGDNVLDLFGGSGTTMIAAEQLGRKSFLMELDPRYVDVIVNRWESLTGGKAVLLNPQGDTEEQEEQVSA